MKKRPPRPPPKVPTKAVRVELTAADQAAVCNIMREQLLDPTRMGVDRVSQKSAILHALRTYGTGVAEG